MRLRHELACDAPPTDVLAMLADRNCRAKVADATRAVSQDHAIGVAWLAGER